MHPLCEPRCLLPEHIEAHRFSAPAALAEQAVHCLELVSELAASGLSFQFKGGNSLLLVLDEPSRFSIDVDIATDEPRERIEACLDAVVASHGVFVHWKPRQHKTKPWLPLASYYLHYRAGLDPSPDPSIMLDCQLRRSPYRTRRVPVACGELYRSTQEAEIPLPASIIGDKLLTMGPFTVGIPLGKGKQAQRLKHVFDVSALLATGPHLADIRTSFGACLQHENELQQKGITAEAVMLDTVRFCATVARSRARPALQAVTDGVLRENVEGLDEFAGHLFQKGYGWARLQQDMGRVALCIAAVVRTHMAPETFADMLASRRPAAATSTAQVDDAAKHWWDCAAAALRRDPLTL